MESLPSLLYPPYLFWSSELTYVRRYAEHAHSVPGVYKREKSGFRKKVAHSKHIMQKYAEIKLRIVHNIDKIDLIKLTFLGFSHPLLFFNHFYLLLLFFIIFKLNKIYDTEC